MRDENIGEKTRPSLDAFGGLVKIVSQMGPKQSFFSKNCHMFMNGAIINHFFSFSEISVEKKRANRFSVKVFGTGKTPLYREGKKREKV